MLPSAAGTGRYLLLRELPPAACGGGGSLGLHPPTCLLLTPLPLVLGGLLGPAVARAAPPNLLPKTRGVAPLVDIRERFDAGTASGDI